MSYRYVALSYVWGRISGSLELKTENLSLLCAQNSLKETKFTSRIPSTITDAMALIRVMGLRYLWVDRLCIIQDAPTHLTSQLSQMASIFANAFFTIIAADGLDANHGLHGVDPYLSPRRYLETSFDFAETVKMVEKPGKESFFYPPFWHTRGWTFQERAVSPRNLVFTNNSVYWECRAATWYENIAGEPDGVPRPVSPIGKTSRWPSYTLEIHPWPDIEQYFSLVGGYNTRNLTFEKDALNAFTAVITSMSKCFPGGFHFGIPIFLFDVGMLWSTRGSSKRRNGFPSWSWLGWTGHVALTLGYQQAWKPDLDFICLDVKIRPLVHWYSIQKDTFSRHLIDNSYHLYQADIEDPDFTVPDGWNKTWNDKHHGEAVQHSSLPSYWFKFPFPIFPAATQDSAHSSSVFLEFEAETCSLLLDASYRTDFDPEASLNIDLLDSGGRWSGVMQSSYVREDEYARGAPCELIAISQGWATRYDDDELQPFDEMTNVQNIKKLKIYLFYNVLWIEWIGSIAYRKAMGRVWEDAWKLQDVKVVKVVLG